MDRYGGRWLLAVSFGASLACYGLTATASSIWGLYLSRVPTVLQVRVPYGINMSKPAEVMPKPLEEWTLGTPLQC